MGKSANQPKYLSCQFTIFVIEQSRHGLHKLHLFSFTIRTRQLPHHRIFTFYVVVAKSHHLFESVCVTPESQIETISSSLLKVFTTSWSASCSSAQ